MISRLIGALAIGLTAAVFIAIAVSTAALGFGLAVAVLVVAGLAAGVVDFGAMVTFSEFVTGFGAAAASEPLTNIARSPIASFFGRPAAERAITWLR